MYESKSDYILQRGCCCSQKNQEKSPIKEISNPMPLEYIFRSEPDSNTAQSKTNCRTTKKPDYNYYVTNTNSTFPRTTRNVLPQIPADKMDLLTNQVKGTLYQEIIDDDIIKPSKERYVRPPVYETNKTGDNNKQIDLVFITSRILVGYSSHPNHDENSKVLRSLRHQYKKNLKIFYLNIRSTIDDQDRTSLNTVSSLPYLMPFLDDIYNFLTAVTVWLHKCKKNVVLLNSSEKANHLCAVCVRFIILHEDMNKRLLRIESLILSDHEYNALQFYEKVNLEKYHTSSLKRYTSTVSNIMLNIIHYQPNLKHLHVIVLKNIHSIDRQYEGVKDSPNINTGHDWKVRSIYLNIYQNFHLIHTTYKVTLNDEIETDRIIYVIDPIIPINGDILIMANITNVSGFQTIYFRFQFHTCLLHGDSASFKNSELDKSITKVDFQTRKIGIVELHLKSQPNIIRDHENMLLSNKYFVVKERGSQSRDILSQLKLLEQYDKGCLLSYTAGPVDGNLYAAIPRPSKPIGNQAKYEISPSLRKIQKCQVMNINTPFILRKFQNLEKEITHAAELISTTSPKKRHAVSDHKIVQSPNIKYLDNDVSLKTNSVKAIKNHQRSFMPYRKSLSLSNNELPTKSDKDERQFFCSYTTKDSKSFVTKNNMYDVNGDNENASPYDNLFPHNTIQQPPKYRDFNDAAYRPLSRMHESNYELVSPTNDIEVRGKFISNLNVPRDSRGNKDSTNTGQRTSLDVMNNNNNNNNDQNCEAMLYDNEDINELKAVYNVSVSRNLWFKPNFSRHDAILYLLDQPVGYFIVRTSTSLSKSLSIVLKCSTSIMNREVIENDSLDHIRHFIIDYNSEGYKIRGFINEKYYSDLTKLIQDHLDKKIGLPCRLVLPSTERDGKELVCKENYTCQDRYLNSHLPTSILNNYSVIYLGSFITKNLTDITAISASVDTLQNRVCRMAHEFSGNSLTKMSMRITNDRIIFTDLNRKMFFRKHCKLEDIICCEVDPKRRVWSHMSNLVNSPLIPSLSPIFGLVSCLTTNTEFSNQTCCQLFLALGYDAEDICSVINKARFNIK